MRTKQEYQEADILREMKARIAELEAENAKLKLSIWRLQQRIEYLQSSYHHASNKSVKVKLEDLDESN